VIHNIHNQTLIVENDTIQIVQNYSQETIELEKTENMEILTKQNCVNGKISLKPTQTICFLLKDKE